MNRAAGEPASSSQQLHFCSAASSARIIANFCTGAPSVCMCFATLSCHQCMCVYIQGAHAKCTCIMLSLSATFILFRALQSARGDILDILDTFQSSTRAPESDDKKAAQIFLERRKQPRIKKYPKFFYIKNSDDSKNQIWTHARIKKPIPVLHRI